jgi:hypothetical protein
VGQRPPDELDAAIIFAPVGELIPVALRGLSKGGVVVCAGIHMSDVPSFPYELLWEERMIRSVANLTRRDGEEFLELAPKVPVRTEVQTYPLEDANEALGQRRLVEALAVVADREHDVAVLLREAHADVARVGMLRDVREELPRGREQQLLVPRPRHRPRVELQAEPAPARGPVADRRERSLEAGRLEDVRVELEQRLPQVRDGGGERPVRALQSSPVEGLGRLLEIVSRREEVLDRRVVEPFGQCAPLALLDGHRLGHQPLALLSQLDAACRPAL